MKVNTGETILGQSENHPEFPEAKVTLMPKILKHMIQGILFSVLFDKTVSD